MSAYPHPLDEKRKQMTIMTATPTGLPARGASDVLVPTGATDRKHDQLYATHVVKEAESNRTSIRIRQTTKCNEFLFSHQ